MFVIVSDVNLDKPQVREACLFTMENHKFGDAFDNCSLVLGNLQALR